MNIKPKLPLIQFEIKADISALEDYISGIVRHVDVLELRVESVQKKLRELEQFMVAKVAESSPKKTRFSLFKRWRKNQPAEVPQVHSPPGD